VIYGVKMFCFYLGMKVYSNNLNLQFSLNG